MLRRIRTTKKLAKRMDLQYFTQPHPFRSWRLWLSILVPVVGGGLVRGASEPTGRRFTVADRFRRPMLCSGNAAMFAT